MYQRKGNLTAVADVMSVYKGDGTCELLADRMPLGRRQVVHALVRGKSRAKDRKNETEVLTVGARDSERIFERDDVWVARRSHLAEVPEDAQLMIGVVTEIGPEDLECAERDGKGVSSQGMLALSPRQPHSGISTKPKLVDHGVVVLVCDW
jgi:hypothetical protein